MPKTISFHTGAVWSRGHNTRDERYTKKQEHINKALIMNNVTICDIPVRQAYEDIFKQAVEEYNAKQKRADRRIKSYYDKIKQDKRKHPVYECIVQIGDKDDTGNSAQLEKQALIKFAQQWENRNPNLKLIGAYIHADEPNGTVHLHCDFIPVAKCTRGMVIQNSYDKALQQQGFRTENIHQTAQMSWQDNEREALCSICRELGIDAQRNQGIGQGREYLTPQEYRRAKDKQTKEIQKELAPLKKELENFQKLKINATSINLNKKKIPLINRTSIPTDELKQLETQAKAYRINRDEIKSVRSRTKEIEKREQQCKIKENEIIQQQKQLQQQYQRQLNLNQLLEQLEQECNSLRQEKLELNYEIGTLKTEKISQIAQIKKLKQSLRTACEVITSVVKATGMLKYDRTKDQTGKYIYGKYGSRLNKEQERLIDGIADYGVSWAKAEGFNDLAEDMQKRVSISTGIKQTLEYSAPQQSHHSGFSR